MGPLPNICALLRRTPSYSDLRNKDFNSILCMALQDVYCGKYLGYMGRLLT